MRSDRTDRIAASIARELGIPDLAGRLASLDASPLGSLLLAVFRARMARLSPAEVRAAADRAALHRPSSVDARLLLGVDAAAFQAARGFEALDLSPVLPLGSCAALTGIDPNNVLSALRGAEVLADPTLAFALEAARRRRDPGARRGPPLRLCASARLVRTQTLEPPPPFTPHFRMFALASAGRDKGGHGFEMEELVAHASTWVRLAEALRADGLRVGAIAVEISDLEAVEALLRAQGIDPAEVRAVAAAHRIGAAAELLASRGAELPTAVTDPRRALGALHTRLPPEAALRLDRVLERAVPALAAACPGVPVRLDLSRLEGLGYYPGLALRVILDGPAGPLPVGDGGFTDWTQSLLGDRKERFLASALGTEVLCKVYGPQEPIR
jgi:hypothetical protein